MIASIYECQSFIDHSNTKSIKSWSLYLQNIECNRHLFVCMIAIVSIKNELKYRIHSLQQVRVQTYKHSFTQIHSLIPNYPISCQLSASLEVCHELVCRPTVKCCEIDQDVRRALNDLFIAAVLRKLVLSRRNELLPTWTLVSNTSLIILKTIIILVSKTWFS